MAEENETVHVEGDVDVDVTGPETAPELPKEGGEESPEDATVLPEDAA